MSISKTNYIKESQRVLNEAGFYDGAIDGKWGVKSHTALTEMANSLKELDVLNSAEVTVDEANTEEVITEEPPVTEEPEKPVVFKKVIVCRFKQSSACTISKFECDWCDVKGFFLEPSGPATVQSGKNRRIPTGIYNLKKHSGLKYKNVVCLFNENVPASRAILIHQGNTPANTVGCLLPGVDYSGNTVSSSRVKLEELMNVIYKAGVENVKLEIVEEF